MGNKIFFSFFNMGTSWKKCDPLVFANFFRNPPKILVRNKEFLRASIWDVLVVESLLGVDHTQSYEEIQKAQAKIS